MSTWTHVDGEKDHAPDPTYNGNGLPAFWTCHKCRVELRLDGQKVPITIVIPKKVPA